MNAKIIIPTFFFLFSSLTLESQWSSATLTRDRYNIHTVRVGDKVLFAGGDSNGSASNNVDLFDLNTGTWSSHYLSGEGKEASFGAAVVNKKKAFFAGDQFSNVIDIYDAETDTWSQATLSQLRVFLAGASIGSKVLFAGGVSNNEATSRIDIYDTEMQSWTTANLSEARSNMGVAVSENKVFFAGGFTNNTVSDQVDIYDVTTDSWTTTNLSEARGMPTSVVISNQVIFAGGLIGTGITEAVGSSTADIYNLDSNSWVTANLKQKGSFYMKAAIVNNQCFFAGGALEGAPIAFGSNIVDIFDADTGEWSTLALPVYHSGFTIAALEKILFFPFGLTYNPENEEIMLSNTIKMYNLETEEWSSHQTDEQKLVLDVIVAENRAFFAGGFLPDQSTSSGVDIYTASTVGTAEPNPTKIINLQIYPNPATDVIHMNIPINRSTKNALLLYDSSGKLVLDFENYQKQTLSLSGLLPGIYYLKIQNENKSYIGKVVKH